MKRKWYLLIFIFLFAVSCKIKESEEGLRYHDDGREKPIVTIVPVFERIEPNLSWSLSDEFTYLLRERLHKTGNIFLTSESSTLTSLSKIQTNQHPFSIDLNWVKQTFTNEQFVVFFELVEHDVRPKAVKAPFSQEEKSTYFLDMLMRVRVVDLRKATPQIILQEFVSYSHKISNQGLEVDYAKNSYGTNSYPATPLAAGHRGLSKKVASRLEDYILLAKSK